MKNTGFFMLELLFVILFCILGVLTGILTGILPGLHVNNIALILLSLTSFFVTSFSFLLEYGLDSNFIFVLIGVFILSCALSHSFHDTIPSTFLGAPDPDTALSVLPAHELLLDGHGFEAVSLSALGSFGAVVFCFLLLLPIRFIIGSPVFFYEILKEIMVFVLVAISILMICTEKSRIDMFKKGGVFPCVLGMFFALFVFLLSGFFGFVVFELFVDSPIGLNSPVLFPALAGLFGMPTLVTSLVTKPVIPEQEVSDPILDFRTKKSSVLSVVTGSLGGILVSIIPGITSATGTVIAMNARGTSDKRQTIVTLSAVNTACAFFVVVMMFVILKSRSGATLAVMSLISVEEWNGFLVPQTLCYFLIALLLSGVFSYFLTLKIGKIFARKFAKVPYLLLIKLTITLVVVLVFLFTGFIGLLVLVVAMFIGLLPVEFGVRRSHCMGILLIPVIFYFI